MKEFLYRKEFPILTAITPPSTLTNFLLAVYFSFSIHSLFGVLSTQTKKVQIDRIDII